MSTRKRNQFDAKEKYNAPYVYWLMNEIMLCIHDKYSSRKMNNYAISRLVPKLEAVLTEVCDESGRY